MVQLLEAERISLLMTVQECIVFITSFLEPSVGREGEGEGFSGLACAPTDLQASCIVYSDLVAFSMCRCKPKKTHCIDFCFQFRFDFVKPATGGKM